MFMFKKRSDDYYLSNFNIDSVFCTIHLFQSEET